MAWSNHLSLEGSWTPSLAIVASHDSNALAALIVHVPKPRMGSSPSRPAHPKDKEGGVGEVNRKEAG